MKNLTIVPFLLAVISCGPLEGGTEVASRVAPGQAVAPQPTEDTALSSLVPRVRPVERPRARARVYYHDRNRRPSAAWDR